MEESDKHKILYIEIDGKRVYIKPIEKPINKMD